MKNSKQFLNRFAFLVLGLSFLAVSCGKKTAPKTSGSVVKGDKIKVSCYVYTPDTTYKKNMEPDALSVVFSSSACNIEDLDKNVSSKVQITPSIDGEWYWDDDSVLVFRPRERWALSTKYKVTFQASLFGENVIGPTGTNFETSDFNCLPGASEFYINPEDTSEKRATFSITASHPIDRASLEKNLILTFNEYTTKKQSVAQKPGYKVTYDNDDTIAYIVSDVLKMPSYTSDVTLEFSGIKSVMGGTPSGKRSMSCTVPGIHDFVRINDVDFSLVKTENLEYDQVIVVETKGKIKPETLLSHMEIWQLPVHKPAEQGWKKRDYYTWTNASSSDFTDLVKSQSTPVKAEIIPGEETYSSMNMFKIHVPQDKYLAVRFTGTLDFFGGYKLDQNDSTVFYNYVKKYPVELGIVSEGALLAFGGSQNIAMYSRGIDEVEYTVSRIMPKDINHLVSMSNGDMRNLSFQTYRFNEKNISETATYQYNIPGSSVERLSYFSYNFSKDLVVDRKNHLENGLFIFQVKDRNSSIKDRRFILVTDLGIVTKSNENGSTDIFVQSVSRGTPVSGAKVRIIGLNGNTLVETSTDNGGHVLIPKLDSKETSRDGHRPVAYVIEKDNDLSFMPYSTYGRTVDYSNFDVGGIYDRVSPDKIDAYLFSDRGMYRPGEKVNIGIIAKAGDWNKNLSGIPVELKVKDSEGKDFFTKQFMLSAEGFEEVVFATRDYSPTGVYNISLSLIKERNGNKYTEFLSSTSVKVEEFLPDTLTVSANFDPLPNAGWIGYEKDVKAVVRVKNLFGTPAAGNEVKARLTLSPGLPYMQKFRGYTFHDPYSKNNYYDENLGSTTTDAEGVTEYGIDLSKFEKASYSVDFYAEAFEKGSGRNVSTRSVIYISPLDYVIGYKADGRLDFINRGSARKMTLIAVDKKLESINLDGVTLKTEEIKYISTLVKQGNGLYKYQSVKKTIPVSEEKISIKKGGTEYFLPSEKSGEYKVTVLDSNGVEFNSFSYNIAGTADVSRSLTRTAELELNVENADFNPGEQAKIFIKAPYKGSGLITIEKDKVYAYKWFTQDSLSSVQTITIPKELEGNGYINVVFKRDYKSDEIFMSPFCYGVVPFSVSKASKTQKINLNIPAEVKSGETLEVKYSTRDKAKIVIYGVDEGIVQTARYQTPNPLSYFFKKRALQVTTSQILDLILPEYNVLKTSMATGGGADMEALLARRLNPFKRRVSDSVVFWSGVLPSSSQEQVYTYKVPDYFNGSMKIYAVAVNAGSIGVEEGRVIATNDFVIQPNSPLAVAPGDEFNLTVNVTNLNKGSKGKVVLTAEPDNHLEISGNRTLELNLVEGADTTVTFKVKAKQVLGGAEIKFVATEKGTETKSKISQTLSVRPNMPYQTRVKAGRFSGSKETVNVDAKTYDEFAKRNVYASVVPTSYADGLNIYLADYPYGCSEQITSKAYPYLFNKFVSGEKSREDCEKMIYETIAILQSRQKPNGQIGYWTDKSPDDYFITLYVAEFLTDCQRFGYTVSAGFFESVMDAVRDIANDRNDEIYDGIYKRSYATYILTKNEIITTNLIENIIRDAGERKGSLDGYAGLYLAASYRMLQVEKEADAMLKKVNRTMTWSKSWKYHNSLRYSSLYVNIIAEYFPEKIKLLKKEMLDDLVDQMEYRNYNTYSVSSGLRAFAALEEAVTGDKEFTGATEIANKNRTDLVLSKDLVGKGEFSKNADSIEFQKKAELPVYWMVLNAGYGLENPTKRENKSIEVFREILKPDGSKITSLKKGDEVLVRISYRTTTDDYIQNIAIIDMQPAFLESDIQSVRKSSGNTNMDYVDVREDRVVLYGNFTKDLRTFEYKARVINSGNFNVPPSYAESMYNPDIYSIAPSPMMTVSD